MRVRVEVWSDAKRRRLWWGVADLDPRSPAALERWLRAEAVRRRVRVEDLRLRVRGDDGQWVEFRV